jgi:hypothetical protein
LAHLYFTVSSNADIETIAALLCERHNMQRDTALGGEEEDFKLHDDGHQMIDDSQLLYLITTLCLDEVPENLINSFGKLQKSPEWQCAGPYRAQVTLIVHFGPMEASLNMIARMFGQSKGAIYKKYEKSQAQCQAHGRPSLLSESQVEVIMVFVLKCFEKGTPATCEMIVHFTDSETSIAISLDAVWHVMRCSPCLKIVTGIPMKQERVEVDLLELKTFTRVYKVK